MEAFRGQEAGAGVVHRRVAGCDTGAPVTLHVARHLCSARVSFWFFVLFAADGARRDRWTARRARGYPNRLPAPLAPRWPAAPPADSKLKLERPHALRASGWQRAPHARCHASHACAGPRDHAARRPPPSSTRSCSRPRWHCTQTAAHAPADTMHAIGAVPSAGVGGRQSEAGSRRQAVDSIHLAGFIASSIAPFDRLQALI